MCERYINWLPLARPQLGTWLASQACALTRNQTSDLSVPRLALSPLSHTSQGYSFYFIIYLFSLLFPSTSPLTTVSLFSIYMGLFLFCLFLHLVLDSTYK